MMSKFNGWQRLWVLVTAIFGFVVVSVVIEEWPSGPRRALSLTACGPVHLSVINQMRAKDNKPALDYEQCLVEGQKSRAREELRELQERDDLRQERAVVALIGLAIWLLGSGLAYLFGWMVAWVRQGFKQNAGAK